MEDSSVFTDKSAEPTEKDLDKALGKTASLWKQITTYVHTQYPNAVEQWNFPGNKYGWNFRIKDRKRAIVYLLPRNNFFKVAFVFGQKATDIILNSEVTDHIKNELKTTRVYAEGRGIRIEVKNKTNLKDIQFLIDTKLQN
ncbi:MAG: DUF3788 domain-containing protein [Cyclobacteriaceae bacterium]